MKFNFYILIAALLLVFFILKTDSAFAQKNELKVYIFLSPECPLCENYSLTINTLQEKYTEIDFVAVFPGNFYSTEKIDSFLNAFNLKLEIIEDRNYELTKFFNASITPEVFLVNENKQILYAGAFDNWMVALGKKRLNPTNFYLADAIDATLNDEKISIKKTKAIGCLIE